MSGVLDAIADAAIGVTGASAGWILAVHPEGLEVVATTGGDTAVGAVVPADAGAAGYVVASGQPVAVSPRPGDPFAHDALVADLGRPATAVLAVPCGDDDGILGAIQLVNEASLGSFSFDDVEIVTVLAEITGVVLREGIPEREVPSPAELGNALGHLAVDDVAAYTRVARAIEAMLAG